MVVIPLDYNLYPYVFCNISNNYFSKIEIIKTSSSDIVQFIESQPISRGYGFHYLLINDNIFEEMYSPFLGSDYLLYVAGGHSNMERNIFRNLQLLEAARFFPRVPFAILRIVNCLFSMMKYPVQHLFIITIGYYVDKLYIENSIFEAGMPLKYSSGLEFLNIGLFSIFNSTIRNIQSETGNALTINTASLINFFVNNCNFINNSGTVI